MKSMAGGCMCRRIRYVADVPTDEGYLCHCRMCQLATGSVSIAFVNVPQANVAWEQTPDFYASSPFAKRAFCKECGSSLGFQFLEGKNMDLTVASFDEPRYFRCTSHAGVESRLDAWWHGLEGLEESRTEDLTHITEKWMKTAGKLPPSLLVGCLVIAGILSLPTAAFAETRTVGAGKQNATLVAAAALANPGDVIEVYDDQTYSATEEGVFFKRAGAADSKITVRGIRNSAGKRPKLAGGNHYTVIFNANHYVFEGFEVTGGKETCITHKADDITIRDSVVHDCPKHGILGTDEGSGSLTLQYVEVYKAGAENAGEALKHPIYVTSDADPTTGFPNSVFRMEHCWVHDAVSGNNVKSRAQRNEIRYNWIEGAGYYEIEMVGPDGPATDLAREDSEVVGNVLVKKNANSYAMRVGGDGTGETKGRYRFLNNTIILEADVGVLRAQDGIESLEFSNNVVFRVGGGGVSYVLRDSDATWAQGQPRISGANNWFPNDTMNIPTAFMGSIMGTDPGFMSSAEPLDLRLVASSALIDKGTDSSPPAPNAAFPNPLSAAAFVPGQRAVPTVDAPPARPKVGIVDIGAFEFGSGDPVSPGSSSGGASSSGGSSGSTDPAATDDASGSDSGGCRTTPSPFAGLASFALAVAALAFVRRRR